MSWRRERSGLWAPSRRAVLGGALAVSALPFLGCGRGSKSEPPGPGAPLPFLTKRGDFYVFSKGPQPSPWDGTGGLEIGPPEGEPASVPWARVRELATRTLPRTIICDGHGFRVDSLPPASMGYTIDRWPWRFSACGTAEWDVVSLADLVAASGQTLDGDWVRARGRDGEEWVYPVSFAREHVWVAVGMNGEALPHEHGAPARLIAEGEYGLTCIKWLASIELRADPSDEREYTQRLFHRAPVKPVAFASTPVDGAKVHDLEVELEGVAYAGAAAVSAVELWFGERGDWQENVWRAELLDPVRPYVWTRWRSRFPLPRGRSTVCVACVAQDGRYATWAPESAPEEPDGWGGIQTLTLRGT